MNSYYNSIIYSTYYFPRLPSVLFHLMFYLKHTEFTEKTLNEYFLFHIFSFITLVGLFHKLIMAPFFMWKGTNKLPHLELQPSREQFPFHSLLKLILETEVNKILLLQNRLPHHSATNLLICPILQSQAKLCDILKAALLYVAV